jgi:glycosyltransferase involved in cell wall biosynthesis
VMPLRASSEEILESAQSPTVGTTAAERGAAPSSRLDGAALHLTVAICTWNRADLLRRTLEQMRQLKTPGTATWELVVVNNNCNDHTDVVLEEFCPYLPLRRIFESKPGLSNARNAAVAAASGVFILWTDDDVLVAPEWLDSYAEAIRRHPTAEILGGPIEPWFEGTPPGWLSRGFRVVEGAYAARDTGCSETAITTDNLPFGANMAVRREVQLRHPYDPALGRAPGNMLGCEELNVLKGILREGGRGFWVPGASVRHFIPRSRQSLSYLWSYWRGNGLSAARIAPSRGRFRLLGSPGWLWRDATMSPFRLLAALLASPPDRWLVHMQTAAISLGRIQGSLPRLKESGKSSTTALSN